MIFAFRYILIICRHSFKKFTYQRRHLRMILIDTHFCKMAFSFWKCNSKRSTFSYFTFTLYFAMMFSHKIFGNIQTYTKTIAGFRLNLPEFFKNSINIILINSAAGIRYNNRNISSILDYLNTYRSFIRCEFESI
ncbi:hypothetical protein D3C86_866560 [compost metagenome]